jgi:hypothetical protein
MALPLDLMGLTATEAEERMIAAAQTLSGGGGTADCEGRPEGVIGGKRSW